jgi:hypothetical protein
MLTFKKFTKLPSFLKKEKFAVIILHNVHVRNKEKGPFKAYCQLSFKRGHSQFISVLNKILSIFSKKDRG